LTAEQRHYLHRVLRLKPGDRFLALDGKGQLWEAVLQADDAQATLKNLSQGRDAPASPQPKLTLVACIPKQGFDEVVRQVTELGIDEIVPILSERTLPRPSDHKLLRWQRIATEAGEQCERLTVPTIREPLTWSTWLAQESQDSQLICVTRKSAPPLLSICLSPSLTAVAVAIGPEGGWTESEVAAAIACGYQPVTLGTNILRAVTAAVTAVGILQAGFEFATIYPLSDVSL
jgi:16S rRNA (uracil1498-N3)-methyltransferase